MTVIQGDSGSGLFNVDTKELVGVVWGCNPSTGETQCIGAEDCRQFLEVCLPRIFHRRSGGSGIFGGGQKQTQPMPYPGYPGNGSIGNCPGGICPQPQPWQPSNAPVNPLPGFDPVQANSLVMQVKTQAEALDKLVGVTSKLSETVTDLSAKIAAVEKSSKCNCIAPVTGANTSPPTAPGCTCDKNKDAAKDAAKDERMKQIEDDLAKLRASLKRSGYVRIQLTPNEQAK